jgi:hypothetical protein
MAFDHPAYHTPPVGAPYVLGLWHRDRLSLTGYRQEAIARWRALRHGQQRRKFLVFARARSGTTLLVQLLRQTPTMRCDGETLHYGIARPRGYLNDLASLAIKPAAGSKLLSYQMVEVQRIRDPLGFFGALRDDGFAFIHLVRDTFAQCVSLSVAQAQSIYHIAAGSDRKGPDRMRLDPELFVRQVRWNLVLLDLERTVMARFDHLALDYDSDLADGLRHQATVDRIAGWLGVESGPVAAGTRRTIREAYGDMIENYDEVVAALRAAGLGHVLPPD